MKVLPFVFLFAAAFGCPHPPDIFVKSMQSVYVVDAADLARPYSEKRTERMEELRGRSVEINGEVIDIKRPPGFTIVEIKGFRDVNIDCDLSNTSISNTVAVGETLYLTGINYGQVNSKNIAIVRCTPK